MSRKILTRRWAVERGDDPLAPQVDDFVEAETEMAPAPKKVMETKLVVIELDPGKPDGLAICLHCWKYWMAGDDRDLSASRMKLHSRGEEDEEDEDRVAYERDVNEEQRIADLRIGEATDAMIKGLSHIHLWAIRRICNVTYIWNFPNADLVVVGPAAQEALREKLMRNIATAHLF